MRNWKSDEKVEERRESGRATRKWKSDEKVEERRESGRAARMWKSGENVEERRERESQSTLLWLWGGKGRRPTMVMEGVEDHRGYSSRSRH
jgi:hypothetical protein